MRHAMRVHTRPQPRCGNLSLIWLLPLVPQNIHFEMQQFYWTSDFSLIIGRKDHKYIFTQLFGEGQCMIPHDIT